MNTASFFSDLIFNDEKVVINALLDSSFGKEIRIAFQNDQVMKEHKTPFPITVMTLKGSIEFSIDNENVILNSGDVIAVEGGILHELKAREESVVRLSLHKGDSVERVMEILND